MFFIGSGLIVFIVSESSLESTSVVWINSVSTLVR